MNNSNSTSVVILTALGVEYDAVRRHLSDLRAVVHRGTQFEIGHAGPVNTPVAIAEVGAGNVGAAVQAERAVTAFNPSLLLFVGVAGGLKDAGIGDVVVATKVYGYETAKDSDTLLSRPDVGMSSFALEQTARRVRREGAWRERRVGTPYDRRDHYDAYIGPIAAGEKVVASTLSRTFALIKERLNDALAVEMEAIGLLRAAHVNPSVDAIVVRGISDHVDGKADADSAGSQEVASASAAAFAVELIVQWQEDRSPLVDDSAPYELEEVRDVWLDLEQTAASLYPTGPLHDDVWSRSGGSISSLDLSGNGRAQWHRAVTRLRQGGGGTTPVRLVITMREDYSSHLGLEGILARLSTGS